MHERVLQLEADKEALNNFIDYLCGDRVELTTHSKWDLLHVPITTYVGHCCVCLQQIQFTAKNEGELAVARQDCGCWVAFPICKLCIDQINKTRRAFPMTLCHKLQEYQIEKIIDIQDIDDNV